jgi:hypothetical protein
MAERHIRPRDLRGKTIDVHTHAGIGIKSFAETGFPYCSSIEALYYCQRIYGVDYSVVFPFNADLFFDIYTYAETGKLVPAEKPISKSPYERENRMLLSELFNFCPELNDRFIPFVSIDPGRKIKEQIDTLQELECQFPIYGIKIAPIACQSNVLELLGQGEAFLQFAHERNWPILFHVTVHPEEEFSQASETFKVMERHPELRYCLAHCVGLHRNFLERADEMPNVWVDTSALKIQTQLAYENSPVMALPLDRLDCDCSDHIKVMQTLVEHFPKTMVWGSDSPFHSYITRRLQGGGSYYEFRLKGTYEEEKVALDALSIEARHRVSLNTIDFIFGLYSD